MSKKLESDRKKPEYKLGDGGFHVPLKDPSEFADTMRILVLHDTKTPL